MNTEFDNILYYCSANKLSINIKKTNFMIISSPNKRVSNIKIHDIEQKDFIKYLGIYIDKHLKWEQQIKHVKSKISKNTGIINKLRFYIDLNTLRQLYYTLIYPYINYGLMSWGNTYTTHLNKIRTAQNKCVKNIFFAHKRENATVYFNLLGILTIDNAFKLKVAIFTFKIINDQICHVFANSLSTASSRHSYNTRFSSRQNFSRPKIRTNYGKHTFQFAASQIWETIDCNIKQSNSASSFKTKYRKKLLINQK